MALAGTSMLLAGCSATSLNQPVPSKAMRAADFLQQELFFIAHRGSGDNWTEHTMEAYRQSLNLGAQAIEISVHRTVDGRFVCHHDPALQRLCGTSAKISELSWDQLTRVRNDARAWLGPQTPLEPIPALDDVLQELGGRAVLFIEDKTGQFAAELIQEIRESPAPLDTIVWKQPAQARGAELAAKNGISTWGYFAPESFADITVLASGFDAIGIHDSADDSTIARAVGTGVPVICWEIHTRHQLESFRARGVRGMMCSNYPYVAAQPAAGETAMDSFATGRRAAGDLPDRLTWSAQPEIKADEGVLSFSGERKASYVLGSMSTSAVGNWRLDANIRWPQMGEANQIAGISFGTSTDMPYRAFESGQMDGYHLQIETNGGVSLWQANGKQPTALYRAANLNPVPGQWMSLRIERVGEQLEVTVGSLEFQITVPSTLMPSYLNLLALITQGFPVDFQGIALNVARD